MWVCECECECECGVCSHAPWDTPTQGHLEPRRALFLLGSSLGLGARGVSISRAGGEPECCWLESWVLRVGPVCCSPALHWVPGCAQGDAQEGLGVFTPQITSFKVLSWGCKPVPGSGGGQAPHPGVLSQHRDGGDTEKPGWEPGSRFPPAALRGSAWYPLGVSSALSHRPRVSPRAPGGSCSGLHPASQHWAAQKLAFAAALCIPATMPVPEGGQSLHSPGTPPLAKPTAPSQLGFSFVVESQEMGKVPSDAFPTLLGVEDARTLRGCITESSFAFNNVQVTRFLPCRKAFGPLQPLTWPFAPSGCGDAL